MRNDESVKNAVRIFDVLPERYARDIDDHLDFPIYEVLQEGIIKENPGIKKPEMVLVYDVTSASPEFKGKYADLIEKLEVKRIIRIQRPLRTQKPEKEGKIVSILPLAGNTYETLTREEQKKVGYDYVSIELNHAGIKIKPVLSIKGNMPTELYVRISSDLSPEIIDKISSETVELVSMPNGLYRQQGSLSKDQDKTI